MPTDGGPDASEELLDLLFAALDHGVESVSAGGPLLPFVLWADSAGERTLERHVAETLEESVSEMRRAVANAPPEVCKVAMVYDGYVTLEGTKYDAVFVEAGERGGASGVVFVQRYRPKGFLRAFSTIGNPAYIGDTDHPLSG